MQSPKAEIVGSRTMRSVFVKAGFMVSLLGALGFGASAGALRFRKHLELNVDRSSWSLYASSLRSAVRLQTRRMGVRCLPVGGGCVCVRMVKP